MKTDRTTKVLLTLIAIGLFLNALGSYPRSSVANAQSQYDLEFKLDQIRFTVDQIEEDVSSISYGLCLNSKIC